MSLKVDGLVEVEFEFAGDQAALLPGQGGELFGTLDRVRKGIDGRAVLAGHEGE